MLIHPIELEESTPLPQITDSKVRVAFVNPPHADWSLANNMTYLMCQSHYSRYGKFPDAVEWLPAPYKWNRYTSLEEVYEEIKGADIVMFSSYAWNYSIVDDLCEHVKRNNPAVLTVLGGPHIGTHEPLLMLQRTLLYDYICQPTKPGEPFVADLLDQWFLNSGNPDVEKISWAIGSEKKESHDVGKDDYSVYEDHQPFLKEALQFAKNERIEPFMVLETTRGCPYKCVFCEWGGGTGTKILKKTLDIVKKDILSLKKAGYRDAYLTDANFGAFEKRDIEIFDFAWKHRLNLTDISTVKVKSMERRKRLIDSWFDIVGSGMETHSKSEGGTDMWGDTEFVSVVPTVSIQSISDEAMRVADRVDLSSEEKIELSRYIHQKCHEQGFPVPALELILAMPGSTKEDFYREMEIIWNFKAWSSFRHDYMFLPDSILNSPEYKEKYQIETVEVYSDITDEDGIDNWNSLYKGKRTNFKTIRSCFSFTAEDMIEMWFMNNTANYLLQNVYPFYEKIVPAPLFAKYCYEVISQLDDYRPIRAEIEDIYNPDTPPRSIRRLGGQFRVKTIEKMIEDNLLIIKNEVAIKCLSTMD